MTNLLTIVCLVAIHTVIGSIVISPKPNDNKVNANIGGDYVITCTATGNDETKPNALEWRSVGHGAITENSNQRIYTKRYGDSLQLLFHNLQPEDSGIYICSAVVGGQPTELSIELTLQKSITFLDTNNEQQVIAGRTDQLIECKAEASPGPTVYWLRKGVDVRNNDKYQITNNGLLLKKAQVEDEGVYTCQALVIATGEAKSFQINVQVITPPKWVQEPKDTEGTRGQDVILRCDATSKPPSRVRFQKNGIDIAGERYIIQESMLTIRRLESADTDTYSCIASNNAGDLVAAFKLTVLVGPVIRAFDSMVVPENVVASFFCNVVEAFPPPTFKWKYTDTQQLIENKNGRFTIVNSGMSSELRIENVRKQDKRNYTCEASNKAAVTEASAMLLVKYPPVLIINEESRDRYYSWFMTDASGTSRGATVLFTCIADGYPEVSIKWYYNTQQIIEGPKYRLLRNEPGYSQLEVTPRDQADFGVYVCQADNSAGKSQRDIPLLIATPPKFEAVIERGVIRPDSLTINVRSPQGAESDGGMPIESYKIQWRLSGVDWSRPSEDEPQVNPLAVNKDIYNYEIKNLQPDTEYVVRVAAVNKPGVGKWSTELSIRTPPRRQPDPVRLLSPEDCGYSDKCVIEWTPEGNGGSAILEYYIRWRQVFYKDQSSNYKERVQPWTDRVAVNFGITKYEMRNLLANSFYEIEINGRNAYGTSASQPYRVKTLTGAANSEFLESQRLSSFNLGLIIAGAIAGFILIVLAIDLCCYFTNKCGIVKSLQKCCKKSKYDTNTKNNSRRYEEVPQRA